MREKLIELWNAANSHCVIMCGEFLVAEWDGDDNPPPPDDGNELVRIVTEYLTSTV